MRDRNFYRGDFKKYREERRRNKAFLGVAIAVVGFMLMLHAMGILPYFDPETSWPFILMIIGVFLGLKSGFRRNAWWMLILVGIANLTPEFTIMGKPSSHFAWPAAVIGLGLVIALRSRKDRCYPHQQPMDSTINTDSTMNIDVTFGGKKEIVTSKDFNGGSVNVTFAGCEINLSQADFTAPSAVLVFQVSFGGIELVVPSHWEVQNEINPTFGSVEDGRVIQTGATSENKKILILRGNCSFGSIEIKSY